MAALALIETPLSPARRELKSLGEQLAAAKANLAAAQAPVDRLLQAIGEHQQAEAERVDLRQAHDRALGEWLASGDGPRPEPATELLAAEHRVRETRVTAAAAEQRLADSQRAVDERNARLGSLATQKASAIYRAATEAARDHLRTKALPAMIASLTELSVAGRPPFFD